MWAERSTRARDSRDSSRKGPVADRGRPGRVRSFLALVGGLAVSARTEPRFTRDADIAVTVDSDEQAEELVYSLKAAGHSIDALVEQEATGRLATVRLSPAGADLSGIVVDLLFASSGIEREVVQNAERLRVLENIEVPVARVAHLIALKVLSRDDEKRPGPGGPESRLGSRPE